MPNTFSSPTPPASPEPNDVWFNTATGLTFSWLVGSGGHGAWVEVYVPGLRTPLPPPAPPPGPPSLPTGLATSNTSPVVYAAPTPPVGANDCDLWYDTVTGFFFIRYNDGNSTQWVVTNPGRGGSIGPPGPQGDNAIIGVPVGIYGDDRNVPVITIEDTGNGPQITDISPVAIDAPTMAQHDTKAPIDSPVLTGTPKAPISITGTNTNDRIATVADFINQLNAVLPSYAQLASPTFTGDPKAPTPATPDNDTSIATTAFVRAAIATYSPPPDLSPYATIVYVDNADALKAPIASPTFTGDPKAPTPATPDNDTSIATTAFVRAAIATYSPPPDLSPYALINSPTFTGDPKAPTPATGDNDTSIATTAFVKAVLALGAPVAVSATPPASPFDGMLWFNSELLVLFVRYNDGSSTQWVPANSNNAQTGVPPGTVMDFMGTTVPTGWYETDGSLKNRVTDAALFSAIGTTYGAGDGSTTFALPDTRGYVLAHMDGGTGRIPLNTLGGTGGHQSLQAHTHAAGSFATPDHLHSAGSLQAASHGHSGAGLVGNNLTNGTSRAVGTADGVNSGYFQDVSIGASGALGVGGSTGAAARSLALGGTSASTGAGTGQNLQPTMAVRKIIKR